MPSDNSPIGQRRQLGAAMRSFRREAGIDRDTAAELIEVTGPTLTRKERGESKFKRQEVETLAAVYGVKTEEMEMLVELAREARAGTKRGEFPLFVPVKTRAFQEMERDLAVEIMVLTLSLIPLYFQTEAYMRTLWLGNGELLTEDRIDDLVRLRKGRQQVVTKDSAPKIRVVMHEFALRLPVAKNRPEVMHRQLLNLADACDLPNVEIQVQPIAAGEYPSMDSTFHLLRFANGPASDMVEIRGYNEWFYRDRESATEPYRAGWDRRRVAALDLQSSKALILDAAAHFGQHIN
jgi:DNA-binding XRE family transcriptional regulator